MTVQGGDCNVLLILFENKGGDLWNIQKHN